jgi:hypothetical protein
MKTTAFSYKPMLTADDGTNYVDFSYNSINGFNNMLVTDIYVVTPETEMRIDLIAIKYFGNTYHIDLICKANNIFNPFDIKEGDVLIIPSITSDNEIYVNPTTNNAADDPRSQFTDKARMSKQDQDRIDRLKALAQGKAGAVANPLPPNMLQPGTVSKTFNDGMVQLGTNLVNNSNK